MPVELSSQLVDTDGLRESLAEICASQEEFSRFFSGVFNEFDAIAGDLLRKQQTWQSDREQAEADFQQRLARVEAERAAIVAEREEAWNEIDERRKQVDGERCQVAAAAADVEGNGRLAAEQFQRILEEAEQDRTAWRSALESAQTQNERLAQLVEELANARSEVAEAREEIKRLRDGLEDSPAAAPAPAQPDAKLQEQLHEMERERAEVDQERVFLESELDVVRNRAAEMAEALAQQQRQMADERRQWGNELKRMRHLLETLSARQSDRSAAASPASSGELPPVAEDLAEPASPSRTNGDPVLGSVMAQFEMLQKDIVRRRKESAEAKSSVN